MNPATFVCLFVLAVVAGMEIHPDDPHNHETLSNDKEELESRVDCIRGRGPCNDMMKDYLQQFPAALKNACANCSPQMKRHLHSFFATLKKEYMDDYKSIRAKFDPEGKFFDPLEAAIANA